MNCAKRDFESAHTNWREGLALIEKLPATPVRESLTVPVRMAYGDSSKRASEGTQNARGVGPLLEANGKGHAAFATWPLLMPATTYSPTHFRVQYNRPCGA